MAERYLTAQEAADLLKVKKSTVYEMIKRGALRAAKLGKQFRIPQEEIRTILQGGPQARAAEPGLLPAPANDALDRFVLCGQDGILDLLADHANRILGGEVVLRSHMGSYNGLYAMYQGRVNAATAHLWDAETGSYNLPFISKLLPGERVSVYHVARRPVGIYVAPGNPKQIRQIEDFVRDDVTAISREKGSGIRVLTDSLLLQRGIDPATVRGCERVAGSHLAAAAAVAAGEADCAVGSQKAALQIEQVSFIPLRWEEYDLILRTADLERPAARALTQVLSSPAFRAEINALGGYDTDHMGEKRL